MAERLDGTPAAAWLQPDAAGTSCTLHAREGRVSAAGIVVDRFVLTSTPQGLLLVWGETGEEPRANRINWSLQDPATHEWSAPTSIHPPHDRPDAGQLNARFVRGAGGNVVVLWVACLPVAGAQGCTISEDTVSKYSGGQWTTRSISTVLDHRLRHAAINQHGQAVLYYRTTTEIRIFRF